MVLISDGTRIYYCKTYLDNSNHGVPNLIRVDFMSLKDIPNLNQYL